MKEMPKPWFQKYFYAKTTTVCASSGSCFQEQCQTQANIKNTELVNKMFRGVLDDFATQISLPFAE